SPRVSARRSFRQPRAARSSARSPGVPARGRPAGSHRALLRKRTGTSASFPGPYWGLLRLDWEIVEQRELLDTRRHGVRSLDLRHERGEAGRSLVGIDTLE